jgi:hypothetical protein
MEKEIRNDAGEIKKGKYFGERREKARKRSKKTEKKEKELGKTEYRREEGRQWWANLDQAPKDLDKTIFHDLSPTPKP